MGFWSGVKDFFLGRGPGDVDFKFRPPGMDQGFQDDMRRAAAGIGTSAAGHQLSAGINQAQNVAQSTMAGARGVNPGMASRMAMQQGSQLGLQGAQQAAALRAQEQQQAKANYMQMQEGRRQTAMTMNQLMMQKALAEQQGPAGGFLAGAAGAVGNFMGSGAFGAGGAFGKGGAFGGGK